MNDCVFSFTCICEDCPRRCDKYISANSEKGSVMLEEYETDVVAAIAPVRKKYKEKYFKSPEEQNEIK